MFKFHVLYSLICEELVRFFSDVKNWYHFFTNVKNRYQILTSVKLGTKSSDVKILNQLITEVKNWYLIFTYVSDKTVKNENRVQNAADLGGILSMLGISMYAI